MKKNWATIENVGCLRLCWAIVCLIACHLAANSQGLDTPLWGEALGTKSAFTANSPINCIFQDRNGNYWVGTNREGAYRFDGKAWSQFTDRDGLPYNQIQKIQEDASGNLWFTTGAGIGRYDGKAFTTFPKPEDLEPQPPADAPWKMADEDVWFEAGGGVYRCNGNRFTYLPLPSTDRNFNYAQGPTSAVSPFTVYSILKDRAGNLWLGTQSLGVCRYDGHVFTWFAEQGLADAAVLAIFEDYAGNIWFGNNGSGVFRYDGKTLANFTAEKGLSNPDFFKNEGVSGAAGLGTMARIYAIAEDETGNLWVGTIDAGIWRYNGTSLTNFTTVNGLDSNTIQCIYKDQNGQLLIGTDGGSLYHWDGMRFLPR